MKRWGWWPGLYVGLLLLVLLMNWPWPRHFASGFVHHFDPPFHTWKLTLVGEQLLHGHILPPDGNTNCFFPSSRALYYEALHWPQAVVAAGLMLFTDNPVLVYHLVLLIFWTLSGLALGWLLRELGAGRATSAFGAVLFCIIPYRASYFIEFNMQLVLGVVLFLLFGVRMFRRPGFWNGVGLGLAFWFQTASELYQAIILMLAAPLIFLPLLVSRRTQSFRDRRLWLGAAGFLVTLPLTVYFVNGYRDLHDHEAFQRDRTEMGRHSLEPASYLLPPAGRALVPGVKVRHDEMSAYPTLAVLLAAAYYIWRWRARAANGTPLHAELNGNAVETHPRMAPLFRTARAAALLSFVAVVLALEYSPGPPPTWSGRLLNLIIFGTMAACVAASLFPARRDDTGRFLSGLGTAAVLCFVMSLGPVVGFAQNQWHATNHLFNLVYDAVPFLGAMRVISRFCVIVMIYMTLIACLGWEAWCARRPRWLVALSSLLVLGSVVWESHPWGRDFDDFDWKPQSSALKQLASPESSTLLVLPFGERFYDSRHMLAIGRHDRLMLYGWGGFYPQFQQDLIRTSHDEQYDRFAELIGEVWPPTEIVVQHRIPPTRLAPAMKWSYERQIQQLKPFFDVVAADHDFTLMRLKPSTHPVVAAARQTRADLLRRNPWVVFTARADGRPPVRLAVLINGAWFGSVELSGDFQTFTFPVPEDWRNVIQPNRVQLKSVDDRPWNIGCFEFEPEPDAIVPGRIMVARSTPSSGLWPGWMSHLAAVPASATPAPVHFKDGLKLLAFEADRTNVRRGEKIGMRFYWAYDKKGVISGSLVHFVHAKCGRGIRFQYDCNILGDLPQNEVHVQPYAKIYVTASALTVPDDAPIGAYDLWTGLYENSHQRRLAANSDLPERSNAVLLPLRLTVTP